LSCLIAAANEPERRAGGESGEASRPPDADREDTQAGVIGNRPTELSFRKMREFL
jgi:hypothetical protein